MTFDDQERTERAFFSVLFRATTEEYEEIARGTYELQVFRDYDVMAQLRDEGTFRTFDPRARAMCEELTRLYFLIAANVRGRVRAMEQART